MLNEMGQPDGNLGPRSVLGEETLFDSRPAVEAKATTHLRTLILTKADVQAALLKFPGGSILHQHQARKPTEERSGGKKMNRREFVKSVKLFQGMPTRLIEDLQTRLKSEFFPTDTWIVTEGEIGDSMYFIADGSCEEVSSTGSAGRAMLSGEYFGDIAALFRERRHISVRTKKPTSCFRLSHEDLTNALQQFPQVRGLSVCPTQTLSGPPNDSTFITKLIS
jgi:CRP-like cAMP-binding protein